MEFPPGVRFDPSDIVIIEDYLLKKVKGNPLPCDDIVLECDLYNKNEGPWKKAFQENDTKTVKNTRFFFTKLKKISNNGNGKKASRTTGNNATWKSQKPTTIYNQLGKVIGTKTTFSYYQQEGSSSERWVMHEYSLNGEYSNLGKEGENYVLCKVINNSESKLAREEQQSTRMIVESNDVSALVSNELPSSKDVLPTEVSLPHTVYHSIPSRECGPSSIDHHAQQNNGDSSTYRNQEQMEQSFYEGYNHEQMHNGADFQQANAALVESSQLQGNFGEALEQMLTQNNGDSSTYRNQEQMEQSFYEGYNHEQMHNGADFQQANAALVESSQLQGNFEEALEQMQTQNNGDSSTYRNQEQMEQSFYEGYNHEQMHNGSDFQQANAALVESSQLQGSFEETLKQMLTQSNGDSSTYRNQEQMEQSFYEGYNHEQMHNGSDFQQANAALVESSQFQGYFYFDLWGPP